jgi:hypothetical protein
MKIFNYFFGLEPATFRLVAFLVLPSILSGATIHLYTIVRFITSSFNNFLFSETGGIIRHRKLLLYIGSHKLT